MVKAVMVPMILWLSLVACEQNPTQPGAGLDAGPGSPECRRAMDKVLHPGDDAYDPNFRRWAAEVIRKCTRGENTEPEQ